MSDAANRSPKDIGYRKPDPDRFVCPDCGKEADVVHVSDRGLVCVGCAVRKQGRDDEARWEGSMARGEAPAEKCAREAVEFTRAREREKEGRKRG